MRFIHIFAVLYLALTVVATQAQTTTSKTDGSTQTQKSKPVSGYLRNVAITFLQAVNELPSEADSAQEEQWDKGMDQLEDRINIALSESPEASLWRRTLLGNAQVDSLDTRHVPNEMSHRQQLRCL